MPSAMNPQLGAVRPDPSDRFSGRNDGRAGVVEVLHKRDQERVSGQAIAGPFCDPGQPLAREPAVQGQVATRVSLDGHGQDVDTQVRGLAGNWSFAREAERRTEVFGDPPRPLDAPYGEILHQI